MKKKTKRKKKPMLGKEGERKSPDNLSKSLTQCKASFLVSTT